MDWNTQENLEKLEQEAIVLLAGLKKQQVEKKKLLARLGLEKLSREEGDEVVRHLIRSGILLKQKDALYSTFGLGYSVATLVKLGGNFGFATPCYGEKRRISLSPVADLWVPCPEIDWWCVPSCGAAPLRKEKRLPLRAMEINH